MLSPAYPVHWEAGGVHLSRETSRVRRLTLERIAFRLNPASLSSLAGALLARAVFLLEAALEPDVREDSGAEQIPGGEYVPALSRRDSVETPPEPVLERQVSIRLQHQRVQVEAAELPVSGPGSARRQRFKGGNVDEDRPAPVPLNVVGGGVLEDHPFGQRLGDQPELQQGGVLQHPERPLVGIGDVGDGLVVQNALPSLRAAHPWTPIRRRPRDGF